MTTTAKKLIEQLQLLKSDTEIAIVWYVADDVRDEFASYVEQEEGEYQLTDDETSEILGKIFDSDSSSRLTMPILYCRMMEHDASGCHDANNRNLHGRLDKWLSVAYTGSMIG